MKKTAQFAHRRLVPSFLRPFLVSTTLAAVAFLAAGPVSAQSQNIDLDGKTGNGNESNNSLTIVSTYPVRIKNKITNKAVGDTFRFTWASAGPGGFTSSIGPGTSAGVGAIWTWDTAQQVFAFSGSTCANDLCFTQTAGPDIVPSRGPFRSPGRSLSSSGVTVSSASLTSSLITFFSPPTTLVSATSSIQPLGGGMLGYTTRIVNTSGSTLTFDIAPSPPGCCPAPNQLNCAGTCVDYLEDPSNCGSCGHGCASGESCASGVCVGACPLGRTSCGGSCVDLMADPANCASCGNVCGANQACVSGVCTTCRPPRGTACGGECVNIHTDSENCGGCGINCNFFCPSTGQGTCSQGQSCLCAPAPIDPPPPPPPAPSIDPPAPVCDFPSTTQTLPPGGVFEDCTAHAVLAREVVSQLTACGASIPDGSATCGNSEPASQGPFNVFVPDLTLPVGNVFLTPFRVELNDASGDRLLQPGETASLKISLLNAGPVTLTGASAVLSSPPVDLTQDGIANPIAVTITTASSPYANIAGTSITGGTSCASITPPAPSANTTPFVLSLPLSHPGDVGRPFNVKVSGLTAGTGQPFQMDVPIVIGIGSACNPSNVDGRFDGVNGLQSPMAPLVRPGETIPFPPKAFQQGKTRPMKLQLTCGTLNLGPAQTTAPQILALSRDGVPVDITAINLNDDANSNDPFFRFASSGSSSAWNYNMRTRDLAKGSYVITIRLAGSEDYVAGFVLN